MTGASQVPHGMLCWVGVVCPGDGEPEKAFYTALFGWDYDNIAEADDPPFYVATLDGERVACLSGSGTDQPGAWVTAVSVADREEAARAVNRAGGSAAPGDTTEIPTVGRFYRVLDPAGAEIHLVEVDGVVAQRVGEPGAWSTSSLIIDDLASVTEFYRDVLGWHLDPSHTTFDADTTNATVDDARGETPQWMPIFGVTDLDAALRTATERRGRVLHAPSLDESGTPTAVLTDPGGARFALAQHQDLR